MYSTVMQWRTFLLCVYHAVDSKERHKMELIKIFANSTHTLTTYSNVTQR